MMQETEALAMLRALRKLMDKQTTVQELQAKASKAMLDTLADLLRRVEYLESQMKRVRLLND